MLSFLNSRYPFYPTDRALSIYCMNSTNDSIQKIIDNYEKNKERNRFKSLLNYSNKNTNSHLCESYNGELIKSLNQGGNILFVCCSILSISSFILLKSMTKS